MKKYKLSAAEVVSLLVYKPKDIKTAFIPQEILTAGKIVHSRLGFTQTKLFLRYFPYQEGEKTEWWCILGMPDRLNLEDGVVEELKTYTDRQGKNLQLLAAQIQCQVYCFLTGLPKYAVWLYDLKNERITDKIDGEYDEEKLKKLLTKAIRLQKKLDEFTESYREEALK